MDVGATLGNLAPAGLLLDLQASLDRALVAAGFAAGECRDLREAGVIG